MNDDIKIENENEKIEDKLKKLKQQLRQCKKEKEEYLDGWQRSKADFINARKEEEKKREELIKYSDSVIINDILPVLDSFDLAFKFGNGSSSKNSSDKTNKGFVLIESQLHTALKQHGLEVIKCVGHQFNPELHEAVEEIESKEKDGIIVEEIVKGYTLHDKVIRAAKVKIAKQVS